MRIGLLTEGGYPYASGAARLWCDRLVRGLEQHEFTIYALSRSERQEEEGWVPLPPQIARVRTAPLWTDEEYGSGYGRRARRRFAECYRELAAALCEGGVAEASGEPPTTAADRFAGALYGLAELARPDVSPGVVSAGSYGGSHEQPRAGRAAGRVDGRGHRRRSAAAGRDL